MATNYRHFAKTHRDYVRSHYISHGASRCAAATGLTITQVWGLAHRMGINHRRKRSSKPPRTADNGHRGIPERRGYLTVHLEQALQHWTATTPAPEEAPA
jgi:hypothetical protein